MLLGPGHSPLSPDAGCSVLVCRETSCMVVGPRTAWDMSLSSLTFLYNWQRRNLHSSSLYMLSSLPGTAIPTPGC